MGETGRGKERRKEMMGGKRREGGRDGEEGWGGAGRGGEGRGGEVGYGS